MLKKFSIMLVPLLFVELMLNITPVGAATKIGSTCRKVNSISKAGNAEVICLKVGKKLIWQKVTNTKKVASKPELPIVFPQGFSDLVSNYRGISEGAWTKVAKSIKTNNSKVGDLEIYTGPNTKPFFDDYRGALGLVSKLFPNSVEPKKNLVIRYKYIDLSWAESKVSEILPKDEITRLDRNEGGKLLSSNCRNENCEGSKQLTTSMGVNLILQGVPNSYNQNDLAGKDRFFSGMLEAHEYFHSLQRAQLINQSLEPKDYPPTWFVEGSAEWVQNATINYSDLKKYKDYFKLDCQNACSALSKKQIEQILTQATNSNWPDGFDYWLNYSLGSIVVESLVSIAGPESLVRLYEQVPSKVGFAEAFQKVFGVNWSDAIPILAEATYLNIRGK